MKNPIYLDYAATTPVDPRVAACMMALLTKEGAFGNPASLHAYGATAREVVETAREQVAALIHAESSEIIWTSGATESINLALKGIAALYQRKGKHIVTMQTEHKAVRDTCQHLEKEGFTVTYLQPEKNGLLTMDALQAALRDDTILVSILHVNNETGVVQDIAAIAKLTAAREIFLHVDAAQSAGKIELDVAKVPIDLLSMSAHKAYGPKGVGALFLRKKPRVRVAPLLHGGGHESGMRSGTLPTHQIAGMGMAFQLAMREWQQDNARIMKLRELFLTSLRQIKNFYLNVDGQHTVPHIINVRFDNMLADAILEKLPMIAASTSSACQSKGTEGSYVLRAMGMNEEQVKNSIRFSFGRFTTEEDIIKAASDIQALFKI